MPESERRYRFMRILVFFDLPVVSKEDRKVYGQFRKFLIQDGYDMLQFSVYCRIEMGKKQ
jgi:CRISPR-associated protein Cas2